MKPDWDKLMGEFADSKSGLVADVDCTTGGKDLCEKVGVSGYPTIKWGDPSKLEDYQGGREYADLKKFADENLGPVCSPDSLELCDEDQKKLIKKYQKWDLDELDMSIEEADEKIKKIETASKKVVDGLQSKISSLQGKITSENTKKDNNIAKEGKKAGVAFMKAIAASRKKEEEDKDEDLDEPKDKKEEL